MTEAVQLEMVSAESFGIGFMALFVTGFLFESCDYNGDGFLDAAEILQDREQVNLATLMAAFGEGGAEDRMFGRSTGFQEMMHEILDNLGSFGSEIFGLR